MGALTVRFPESLHEKVRTLASEEGISMNQFAVLAVSEKVARLDAEDQLDYLSALEQVGEELAARQGQSLEEAAQSVLDAAAARAEAPGSSEEPDQESRSPRAQHTS